MQYLTVQYLLAKESLKLLTMNLNIMVAVTSNQDMTVFTFFTV